MRPWQSSITWMGLVAFACVSGAAVEPGENLLLNGAFDAEQVAFPEFWAPGSSKVVFYERSGGPEGKKAAALSRRSRLCMTATWSRV